MLPKLPPHQERDELLPETDDRLLLHKEIENPPLAHVDVRVQVVRVDANVWPSGGVWVVGSMCVCA